MVSIGIDIGTSNTVIATVTATGEPQIRMVDQHPLLPSVIYIDETAGARSVGHAALEEWANPDFDQAGSFRRWKLRMGDGTELRRMRFGGPGSNITTITPELLTTWLVEHVVGAVSTGVGGETVDSVLVTVPHGWRREDPLKCRATRLAAGAARVSGQQVHVQPTTLSEPVAAAVYWLWEARQRPEHHAEEFIGRTLLVCDVGGGTFDLSLVRVGEPGQPLIVVDAINHEYAGDYVTSLIMARVAQAFKDQHDTALPATPEDILSAAVSIEGAWLRQWFITSQQMQMTISQRIHQAALRGRRVRGDTQVFVDQDGRNIQFSLTADEFTALLEPFYDKGRTLVRHFLSGHSDPTRPYAVVFAGGGSRIAGVRDQVVLPALQELTDDADQILGRIVMNDNKVDQAIALGAALVANGIVTVQERLLYDVGIESQVDASLSRSLGLPPGTGSILLTPVLPRGATLPARFQASEHSLPPWGIAAAEDLDIKVVIDDDPDKPWVQSWAIPHPAGGRAVACDVVIDADADGVLSVTLNPVDGRSATIVGRLERTRSKRGGLVFRAPSGDQSGDQTTQRPRVTPTQMRDALSAARRSAAR